MRDQRYNVDVESVGDSRQRYIIRDTYNQYKIVHRETAFEMFDYQDDGYNSASIICKGLNLEYLRYNAQLMELDCWPHYYGE